MNADAGWWLWWVIDVAMVAALGIALVYGTMVWRKRRAGSEAASEQATRDLYERGARAEMSEGGGAASVPLDRGTPRSVQN
ncbi:MAG: hypothetical protein ACJ8F3_03075 [Xanthobacteraceae bacterium]